VSEQDLLDNAKMINAQWKRREAEASRPQVNGVSR
jgi:mRNA guanylyltransferase